MIWYPFLKGFGITAGLITAIGAQNTFVLRQGLLGRYRLAVALLCAGMDAVLITLGVAGLGLLIQQHPGFLQVTRWFGIVFLVLYGLQAFISSFRTQTLESERKANSNRNLRTTLMMLLALTLLNPHVYLDTVILIGSVGSNFHEASRWLYIIGATCASLVWFFALSFGSKYLQPLFHNPIAWKVLDGLTALIMWFIAWQLYIH